MHFPGKRNYEEMLSSDSQHTLDNPRRPRRSRVDPHDRVHLDDALHPPSYLLSDDPESSRRKAAVHNARSKQKERKARWKQWCEQHQWEHEHDPDYKQKVGSKEVQRSDAMSYFRLKGYEITTLPHVTSENGHDSDGNSAGTIPERSYSLANLHTLVARKSALLAGLDPNTHEVEFLKRGWELFSAKTAKLAARTDKAGKHLKQLKFSIVFSPRCPSAPAPGAPPPTPSPPDEAKVKTRPFGSWTTPVYEDGVRTGDWLSFQFDPECGRYDDFYKQFVRFRPINADWNWEMTECLHHRSLDEGISIKAW